MATAEANPVKFREFKFVGRKRIGLHNIIVDESIQCRSRMFGDYVELYAQRRIDGSIPPPLVVFEDGAKPGEYVLSSGFHRLKALIRAAPITGDEDVLCEVYRGDRQDALLFSAQSNNKYTSQILLTSQCWRVACDKLFPIKECWEASCRLLSDYIGASRKTVERIKSEYALKHGLELPPNVIRRDGTSQSASRSNRIGGSNICRRRDGIYGTTLCGRSLNLGNISPQDAARRKAEAEAEVEMRRSTLRKTAGCVNYLYRRGVPVETIRFRRYQSGSVLAGRGFMAALCPEQSGESIQRCVGMITLLRHKHEDPAEAGRMVILIPEGEEDGGEKELKELAVKAGFEFMTPDELVAEFGPKASN